MKILIHSALAAALLTVAGSALAQEDGDEQVRRIYFDHVKPTMRAEFHELTEDWNRCLADNGAESGWSVWTAETGRAYRYAFVVDGTGWARFDEDSPAHDKCYQQMEDRYTDAIQMAHSQFDQAIPRISHHVENDAEYKVAMVYNFRVKDEYTFVTNAARIAEAAKAAEYPHPYYFWSSVSGRNGPTHYVVVPRASFAELGSGPDFWAAITEQLGRDTMARIREENMAAIEGEWDEIWTHQEELSYQPEE
ncbi:MAG: hypothetical protein ACNS61_09825 [Candidatus Wenzhouxiangella sp. M2_3B_020]